MQPDRVSPERPLIERLARHLASADDGEGWRDHIEAAGNILALLKTPDTAMREAGDVAAWEAMVDAALAARWPDAPAMAAQREHVEGGADEEGEMPLRRRADAQRSAGWIQMDQQKGTSR